MQAIERDIAPVLARHRNETFLNNSLFARIDGLKAEGDKLGLSAEQARVLKRYHLDFTAPARGCHLRLRRASPRSPSGWRRSARNSGRTCWRTKKHGSCCSMKTISTACRISSSRAPRALAAERGHPGRYAVTLSRSNIDASWISTRRDLRETAFRAWAARGENGGATDNREIAAEMVRLRAERARLIGYETYAHYRLADTMAKTPQAALDLLELVWTPAVRSALTEQEALQEIVADEGGNFKVAPWDSRYLAEKRRKAEFDFDEGELKPDILQLDRMIEAAFYAAGRLFGLEFAERFDLKLYDPDVRAWTVLGLDGSAVALLLRRLFRAALKAKRGVDERFPRAAAETGRPAIPDCGQCDEFHQRRRGRAKSVEFRRRADALP